MHQEGLQKAEVIGLEYSIERQTTKDIHLCLMAFQLFCDWLEFIWLFGSPALPRTGERWGGRPPGPAQAGALVRRAGGACATAVCVWMYEAQIPPKPRGHLCDHYHNHIKAAGD